MDIDINSTVVKGEAILAILPVLIFDRSKVSALKVRSNL